MLTEIYLENKCLNFQRNKFKVIQLVNLNYIVCLLVLRNLGNHKKLSKLCSHNICVSVGFWFWLGVGVLPEKKSLCAIQRLLGGQLEHFVRNIIKVHL